MQEETIITSTLAITNVLKLTVYSEENHSIETQYRYPINDRASLEKATELIDSLDEAQTDVLLADEDYICPIPEMEDILSKLDGYTRDELVVLTLGGSTRGENELIIYDFDFHQLTSRMADDIKHIIYEDYKLYLACSNILFRFETKTGDYFYIKLNSGHTDINLNILDMDSLEVELEFTTLVKPGSKLPFADVEFITSIDVTRSKVITMKNTSLLDFSGIQDPEYPVRFVYRGTLVSDLGDIYPTTI